MLELKSHQLYQKMSRTRIIHSQEFGDGVKSLSHSRDIVTILFREKWENKVLKRNKASIKQAVFKISCFIL